MMKKLTMILMSMLVFFVINSCSKHEDEAIFDCLAASIYIKLHNSTDANFPKVMNYSIEYNGTGTVVEVKWTFGDGTTGAGTVVTHLYPGAGTYEAKADVTIKKDASECTSTLKRTVTID